MKIKNLGKPDYASIEDRRGIYPKPDNSAFIRQAAERMSRGSFGGPTKQSSVSTDAYLDSTRVSISKALQKMGNQPLPSRRPPQGNNPGSAATMKFPKPTRSK